MTEPLAVLLPGFDGPKLPAWVAERLRRGMAGVWLFGSNGESPRQLRELTDAIRTHNPHALIAIDEEGGDVTRLYYDRGAPTTGNAWLGRHDDLKATQEVGASIARELRAVGVNLNFAPTVDVNSNDDNPVIGVRSFGADPRRVAGHTTAWVRGHQAAGVAACVKHFPGHGDTDLDSHLALPTVDEPLSVLRERELLPFRAAIADADVWAVMTSHILLPQLDADQPATFSAPILRDLLRTELGFEGVVVSDALDMAGASGRIGIPQAAVDAIAGGCDLLCIGTSNTPEQMDAIEAAVADAYRRDELVQAAFCLARGRVAALAERVASPSGSLEQLGAEFAAEPDGLDVTSAFELNDRARALLAAAPGERPWTVLVLDTTPNNAAGTAPWGVAAAAGEVGARGWLRLNGSVESDVLDALPVDHPVAVVGRDNHRHAWVRRLVDRLRDRRPDVLLVDMGWPDASRTYADIATFGASRRLGEGVLDLLDGRGHQGVDG
jgi:beta-N-acetylhexosaminidase